MVSEEGRKLKDIRAMLGFLEAANIEDDGLRILAAKAAVLWVGGYTERGFIEELQPEAQQVAELRKLKVWPWSEVDKSEVH